MKSLNQIIALFLILGVVIVGMPLPAFAQDQPAPAMNETGALVPTVDPDEPEKPDTVPANTTNPVLDVSLGSTGSLSPATLESDSEMGPEPEIEKVEVNLEGPVAVPDTLPEIEKVEVDETAEIEIEIQEPVDAETTDNTGPVTTKPDPDHIKVEIKMPNPVDINKCLTCCGPPPCCNYCGGGPVKGGDGLVKVFKVFEVKEALTDLTKAQIQEVKKLFGTTPVRVESKKVDVGDDPNADTVYDRSYFDARGNVICRERIDLTKNVSSYPPSEFVGTTILWSYPDLRQRKNLQISELGITLFEDTVAPVI